MIFTSKVRIGLLAGALVLFVGCGDDGGGGSGQQAVQPYGDFISPQYAGGENWLCHPLAQRDYCLDDLDATIVYPDGSTEIEEHVPASNPAIDCFYVYPTWSQDPTGNSDLIPADDQEGFVVQNQAARLNRVCRVFAPVYRQVTIQALFNQDLGADSALAQADVVDSFKHYIANDNDGRGFVLIGHSQGAGRLRSLIQSEVEPDPFLRDHLVSAILLGSAVTVPEGEDVGGSFDTIPVCREPSQTGCVISYSSYRSTNPPTSGALFGDAEEGFDVVCANPVGLSEGAKLSKPYFPTQVSDLLRTGGPVTGPFADPEMHDSITTPYYTMPDFLQLRCAKTDEFDYLEVTVLGDSSDPRSDDFTGALESILPGWGLHIVDATVAMGDLVELVEQQTAAYTGR